MEIKRGTLEKTLIIPRSSNGHMTVEYRTLGTQHQSVLSNYIAFASLIAAVITAPKNAKIAIR